MNSRKKALDEKITGHSSKRQLETESIPFLRKLEKREKKEHGKDPFGTFEQRFKKYSKWKNK